MIISTSEELYNVCKQAFTSEYIAFDTEFIRKRGMYYPIPSLIQFSYDGDNGIICDVLMSNIDWSPLQNILEDNKIQKIFHSIKQDMDVLYKFFGIHPQNVFDVQLAAMFLGRYYNPSYDLLVRDFLNKNLNKELQFSDWGRRPLSRQQLEYAARDVTYLYRLFPKIRHELGNTRIEWIKDEIIINKEHQIQTLLEKILLRLIFTHKPITPRGVFILNFMLHWREEYSLKNNQLRDNIMNNHTLTHFVHIIDKHFDELSSAKIINNKVKRQMLKAFQDYISNDLNLESECVKFHDLIQLCIQKKNVMCQKPEIYQKLKTLLNFCSAKSAIHHSIICDKSDLIDLIARKQLSTKLQSGWRYDVFGQAAIEMITNDHEITINQL